MERAITVPIISTVKKVVEKDVFTSKKYKLALNILMWGLTCWGSIPDCAILVSRVIKAWNKRHIKLLLYRFFTDFFLMAFKFFVRRAGVVAVVWLSV